MRFSRRTRCQITASLFAAGWATLSGPQSSRGDFQISVYDQLGVNYQGNIYDVYVLAAINDGLHESGGDLAAEQVIINSGGPSTFNSPTGALAIDVEQYGPGTGSNAKYIANVIGSAPAMSHGVDAGGPAVFGDPASGTFAGIGFGAAGLGQPAPYSPDYVDNPDFALAGYPFAFVQGQTGTYMDASNKSANYVGTLSVLDPAFENNVVSGANQKAATVNVGNVTNETVHSLEVDSIAFDDSGSLTPTPATPQEGAVPFAQVVVAPGTVFTMNGFLAGTGGWTGSFAFKTVLTAGIPTGGPSITAGSAPSSNNLIGTVTMVGTGGTAGPQNVHISGVAQTAGSLVINGVGATNVYGLHIAGDQSDTQLISDLNNAMQISHPGALVEAPTGVAGSILSSYGDNVEVVLPNSLNITPTSAIIGPHDLIGGSSGVFSYDLSSYTSNGSPAVTQITVLPEPGMVITLMGGGIALMQRRRKWRSR